MYNGVPFNVGLLYGSPLICNVVQLFVQSLDWLVSVAGSYPANVYPPTPDLRKICDLVNLILHLLLYPMYI